MKTIEATYRIVTPMFIGGANHEPSDDIRPPSFKGALRFWWRALNWGKFYQEKNGDEAAALKALHTEECRLFGSAAKIENGEQIGGQGCFLLTIQHGKFTDTKKNVVHSDFAKVDGARYLSYGLMEAFSSKKTGKKAGQLIRGCINEAQGFTAELVFKDEIELSIQQALITMGLLGGLGSRSRKGLGSIALQSLKGSSDGKSYETIWSAPKSLQEYKQAISDIIKRHNLAQGLPPISAFSQETDILYLLSETNPFAALNTYGEAMLMYRSWGKGGKVLGKTREENFKGDHDWSKGLMPEGFHPRRVVFGLPHNYGKQDCLHVEAANHKRRSSPLFYHVHQIGNQYIGIAMLLPAQFLPKDEKIKAGKTEVDAKIEWDVLTGFLHGKDKHGNPRFENIETIVGGQS